MSGNSSPFEPEALATIEQRFAMLPSPARPILWRRYTCTLVELVAD